MAGMPGMLVAWVFSGAHVITVMGSLEPPVTSETSPHPAASDAQAAHTAAESTVERRVREVRGMVVRRRPVMNLHDSPASLTHE
ncbi:hypothetical protein GCM10009646_38000 [Streptomyces aureus]